MSLGDIRREDVLKALEEYTQLGEERFLQQYAFGPATKHYLVHEGRDYPAMAILGVAHRFVKGAAMPTNSLGGGAETNNRLRALGFEVREDSRGPGLDRTSAAAAKQHVERLVPDAATRTLLLTFFADVIDSAHGVAPDKWSVTMRHNRVTLNVGQNAVLTAYTSGCWMACRGALPPDFPKEFITESKFSTMPNTPVVEVPWAEFPRWGVPLRSLTIAAVLMSAEHYTRLHSGIARAHSPGFLDYLEAETGKQVPRPALEAAMASSAAGSAGAVTLVEESIYDFLEDNGLHFSKEVVTTYLLSLKTKPFVILSGISGTGKTKLAQAVAEWAGAEERLVSVVPQVPPGAGVWQYVLSQYTFDHRKIVIAREAEDLFWALPDQGSQSLGILYGDETYRGSVGLVHSKGRVLYELRLGVPLTERLKQEAQLGDRLNITVEGRGDPSQDPMSVRIERDVTPLATHAEPISRHTFVSVRPDWLDHRGLLGFYNLLSESYVGGAFLERVLEAFADEVDEKPHFVTLDEMNLARVEHYFADVLSVTESRQADDAGGLTQEPMRLHSEPQCLPLDEMPQRPAVCAGCRATQEKQRACKLHPEGIRMVPPSLRIPTNLFITGTVNIDETTHMFSPKVLDRANVIEFNEVDLLGTKEHGDTAFSLKNGAVDLGNTRPATLSDFREDMPKAAREKLAGLNALLEPYHLHFGYRVANEVGLYVQNAVEYVGKDAADTALDLQVLQKVLPKLHGTKQRLLEPLWKLLLFTTWATPPDEKYSKDAEAKAESHLRTGAAPMPRSAKKLLRMLRRVQEQGFVSFIE